MATAHTDEIIRRMDVRQLATAVKTMADRYAESDRDAVYAYVEHSRSYIAGDLEAAAKAKAEHERNQRAAMRRRDALARLTDALRDVALR